MEYVITVEQDKSISRFGWFWKVSFAGFYVSNYAFTKNGAIRAAKGYIRKEELSNKKERFVIRGKDEN